MSLLENLKMNIPAFWTTPSIANAHNAEENVQNIMIAEGDPNLTEYQTYYPNSNFSFYKNNKFVSAVSSGNDRSYDKVDSRSGDIASIGRIGSNFQRNGVQRFQTEQQETVQNMIAARQTSDANHNIINNLSESYPESEGWILSDAGAKGVIATNYVQKTYGVINNEGVFVEMT